MVAHHATYGGASLKCVLNPHDPAGRIISIHEMNPGGYHAYRYDGNGQLISDDPIPHTPGSPVDTWTYDANGKPRAHAQQRRYAGELQPTVAGQPSQQRRRV